MESHSGFFANKPNIFLAFHFYLSRNCHCVNLSLAVRTEWVIFFEAGTFLFLSRPLPKPHPFSSDKFRLVFSHSPGSHWFRNWSPRAKSIIRTRPCSKARQARMSASIYESELMKASPALFPNTSVSPMARCPWMEKRQPCLAAAAAPLGFALPVVQPLLVCTGDKNPPAESQQWTASGAVNNLTQSMECREQGLDLPEDAERDEDFLLTFHLVEDLLRKLKSAVIPCSVLTEHV